jgi:hypothetical protein
MTIGAALLVQTATNHGNFSLDESGICAFKHKFPNVVVCHGVDGTKYLLILFPQRLLVTSSSGRK